MGPTVLYDGGKTTGNETMNIKSMAFFTGFYVMLYHSCQIDVWCFNKRGYLSVGTKG